MSSEETVETIIRTAARELAERGLRGFGVRKVARAARVSLGTLTYYFPTKDRLLDAVLSAFVKASWSNWQDWSENLHETGLDPIITGFYALCREHRPEARLIVHLSARDGRLWGALPKVIQPLFDDVERQLGREHRLLAHTIVTASLTYALYSNVQLQQITGTATIEAAHDAALAHLLTLANSFSPNASTG